MAISPLERCAIRYSIRAMSLPPTSALASSRYSGGRSRLRVATEKATERRGGRRRPFPHQHVARWAEAPSCPPEAWSARAACRRQNARAALALAVIVGSTAACCHGAATATPVEAISTQVNAGVGDGVNCPGDAKIAVLSRFSRNAAPRLLLVRSPSAPPRYCAEESILAVLQIAPGNVAAMLP